MIWVFFILAIVSIVSAISVVALRNPIYSVLALIVCFFSIAAHYLLLNAEFLAAIQVIVYAGAIMVLFLFVLMLMNLSKRLDSKRPLWFICLSVLTSGVLLISLILSLTTVFKLSSFCPFLSQSVVQTGLGSSLTLFNLGKLLFHEYLLAFELSSLLFLAALVGVVVLSKKNKRVEVI